ncbi:hypothetical protein V7S43_007511 [Phytophthora oleae]|uniref:HAT C-terminal dimerisation domain-containing protein n=1 Tax=Phytophthora oleae TaxID=2107226 RepID=A0ABD3FQJ7_9STRA
MIYHYFQELSHHRVFRSRTDDIEDTVFPDIQSIIQKRWNSMKRDSVLAAYLLDPSKSPDDFDGNDLDRAVDACVALAVRVGLSAGVTEQAFYDALMKFIREKDGRSPEKWAEASSKAPLDWWRLKSSDFAALKEFATRVLSIPTSSAASERS